MSMRWPFKKDITRRDLFIGVAGVVTAGFATKWLADAFSTTDKASSKSAAVVAGDSAPPGAEHFFDVDEFKKTLTVEELCKTSEAYFAAFKDWDFPLAKPLWGIEDAPQLLLRVAHLLDGLQLSPGMTVVDFGAGSCWASRWLTQLGMEVIALDVSKTALKIGQELYARQPVFGDRPRPRFLPFDGHRIDLPDSSVDRIFCLDTFHHVLNPDQVMHEMSRILNATGIAGFSEPGPNHSRAIGAQLEMRNYRVLEDDIRVQEIWSSAKEAGFKQIKLAVYTPQTSLLSLPEFEDYLDSGLTNQRFAEVTRFHMQQHRMFFLKKSLVPQVPDSRRSAGLTGNLEVKLASAAVKNGAPLIAQVVITNSGLATWLPNSAKIGAVRLGCHLLSTSGEMLEMSFFQQPLIPGDGRSIKPGETLKLEAHIPSPPKGNYILEFDLVSASVIWFSMKGSRPVRLPIQIT